MADKEVLQPTYVKVCDLCEEESFQDDSVEHWDWGSFYFDAHHGCHASVVRQGKEVLKLYFENFKEYEKGLNGEARRSLLEEIERTSQGSHV